MKGFNFFGMSGRPEDKELTARIEREKLQTAGKYAGRMSVEMQNDMNYQGSKAFSPRGTKVWVEGIQLPEVRCVGFTPDVETRLVMNWIPESPEQNFLIDLFLDQEVVGVEFKLPCDRGERAVKARISDLNITLPADDAARMYVVFKQLRDPADDGPEVEIILDELNVRDEAFEELLNSFFAKMRQEVQAIRALAKQLRDRAQSEFHFCASEEAREQAVGARLDLADELETIADNWVFPVQSENVWPKWEN